MDFRVLHVLDHSWPVLDGYSQRSRSIIDAQKSFGWYPIVLTGPLHNIDDPTAAEIDLDSIRYFRTPRDSGFRGLAVHHRWPFLRECAVVNLLEKRILTLLDSHNFDVIHAHSPALCGLAALRASRTRKLPFVYEIRSFWEDGVLQSPSSLKYRLARSLETYVVMRADAVVGIARPILQDLAERGAPEARLFHVPNGVDASRFTPRRRDTVLAAQMGLTDVPTIGFLGTLFPWEGVAWLAHAAAALHARGVHFKMIIVGDGAEAAAIRAAIAEENAHDYVQYLGRVPHEDVGRYYSIMDLLVYPRHSMRITEFVTPLKPLEAMALAKPILGSAVGGIRELIDAGVTGLLFEPGNIDDFCRQAKRMLESESLRTALGNAARAKVCQEKGWTTVTARYAEIYKTAIDNARPGS